MNLHITIRNPWPAALLSIALAGCGGPDDGLPRQALSGTVTWDGEPLAEGTIQFMPASAEQGTVVGAAIEGGRFAVPRQEGPVPGQYRVMINCPVGGPKDIPAGMPGAPLPKGTTLAKELLPPRYNTRTTLTARVKDDGPNTFEFALVK